MAIYPFILLNNKRLINDNVIINHEKIHLRQQIELLILPFYVMYLLNYLINRVRYKTHNEAYLNIIFEQEAYLNELNLNYLSHRKWFAWAREIKT